MYYYHPPVCLLVFFHSPIWQTWAPSHNYYHKTIALPPAKKKYMPHRPHTPLEQSSSPRPAHKITHPHPPFTGRASEQRDTKGGGKCGGVDEGPYNGQYGVCCCSGSHQSGLLQNVKEPSSCGRIWRGANATVFGEIRGVDKAAVISRSGSRKKRATVQLRPRIQASCPPMRFTVPRKNKKGRT